MDEELSPLFTLCKTLSALIVHQTCSISSYQLQFNVTVQMNELHSRSTSCYYTRMLALRTAEAGRVVSRSYHLFRSVSKLKFALSNCKLFCRLFGLLEAERQQEKPSHSWRRCADLCGGCLHLFTTTQTV